MGFIDSLRMMNIYNPMAQMMSGGQQEPQMDMPDFYQAPEMEHQASDIFNQMISQQPQRENPGLLRKLASIPFGISRGGDAQMDFLNQPYNQKLADWKTGLGPAYQAAQLENQGNTQLRTIASNMASNKAANYRLDLTAKRDQSKADKDKADIKLKEQKLELDRWKADNPDGEIVNADDGFVHLVNPVTGKDIKTEVKHGDLSDIEKERWKIKGIQERGSQSRQTKALGGVDASDIAIIPQYNDQGQPIGSLRYNKVTKELEPITLGPEKKPVINKPDDPKRKDVRFQQKIKDYLLAHPEDENWFDKDNSGTYALKTPSTGFIGMGVRDKTKYDEIRTALQEPTTLPNQPVDDKKILKKTQTNAQTGEKRTLISTDGGKTWQVGQ